MSIPTAYEEVAGFIAAGASPENVIAFRPSEAVQNRVWELVGREKADGLTPDETSELEHYLQLEYIMRLAKARARCGPGKLPAKSPAKKPAKLPAKSPLKCWWVT